MFTTVKRQIDHRLATHFHPVALPAQIAEVGQRERRSQAKLLLKGVADVGAASGDRQQLRGNEGCMVGVGRRW